MAQIYEHRDKNLSHPCGRYTQLVFARGYVSENELTFVISLHLMLGEIGRSALASLRESERAGPSGPFFIQNLAADLAHSKRLRDYTLAAHHVC